MGKGMLIDITKCIGCRACQTACKQWNDLPATETSFTNSFSNPPQLTATNYTRVGFHFVEKEGRQQWRFAKIQCMHCEEPACVSACFSRALRKTAEGPILYEESLCVGCRYCMLACPFDIPTYEWEETFPAVCKCRLCYDRIQDGLEPACVETCPTNAVIFGERKELLAEARSRINKNPNSYIDHVYGEKEAGGTAVLYLSDVSFGELGFRSNIPVTPPSHYSEEIIHLTPAVAIGWGAVLTGLYFYNRRRNEIAREENEEE